MGEKSYKNRGIQKRDLVDALRTVLGRVYLFENF